MMHPCESCGQLTENPRFCSQSCAGSWLGRKAVENGQLERMQKEWNGGPEHKAHLEQMRNNPKRKERLKEWNGSPEGKAQFERVRNNPKQKERLKEWLGSPEGKAQLKRLHKEWLGSLEGKAHLERMQKEWVGSPEGKAHLERMQKEWNGGPENLAVLVRARATKYSPSKEEINRLHNHLPGWSYNAYLDPHDGRAPVEVDAQRGKVCAFYDGVWWHRAEKQEQDRRQRARLEAAGYVVRSVFNRAPTDAEVEEWNRLANAG